MNKSINLEFDKKNKDVIIWNNQIVMSRTEENYFINIFKTLSSLKINTENILEIGFGLGISSLLIQNYLRPKEHHIVEIEENIFKDLISFSLKHPSIRPLLGDWRILDLPHDTYSFIFFDAYDYLDKGNDSQFTYQDQVNIFREILTDNGVLCHPHFGDGPIQEMNGFKSKIIKRLKVTPIRMWDNSICEDAAVILRYKIS